MSDNLLPIVTPKELGYNTYETARSLIESEVLNFSNDPIKYIESMGWDKKKWKHVAKFKDKVLFSMMDIQNLQSIIDSAFSRLYYENGEGAELTIAISELNSVSDFLCNHIAGQLQRLKAKV